MVPTKNSSSYRENESWPQPVLSVYIQSIGNALLETGLGL